MALAASALEFIILSGRPVKAVARLAQCRPFQSRLSLVFNHKWFARVRAPGNWRNLHFGDLTHCAAGRFPDLTETVQIFEFDRGLS